MSLPVALVLGGHGLLGQALMNQLKNDNWDARALSHEECNFLDPDELHARIDFIAPDVILNAVAWTQVNEAETHPEASLSLNRGLPGLLGTLVRGTHTRLIHFSTASVFSGHQNRPYTETDTPDPQSVYGVGKLGGEQALLSAPTENICVVRTSWLYGPGRENPVSRLLMEALHNPTIPVAHDIVGSPTYTPDLAKAVLKLLTLGASGLYHVTNTGQASWCELIAEAVRLANIPSVVQAVPASQFPELAHRPHYAVLSSHKYTALTGQTLRPWPQALRDYVFTMLLER